MSSWEPHNAYGVNDPHATSVRAAQGGDRRAFDALVNVNRSFLLGFLARRVGAGAAEDVLQETWLAAWIALPRFTRRSSFKAWLFGIAVHKALDYHRSAGRAEQPPATLDEYPSPGSDPFAASDLRQAIQTVLSGLPTAQREVLDMYYFAELTMPEIAHALNRNLNTVKYQFYEAHKKTAKAMEAHTASEYVSRL